MTEILDSYRFDNLASERMKEFETKYSYDFPVDYKEFRLEHNGGKPKTIKYYFSTNGFVGYREQQLIMNGKEYIFYLMQVKDQNLIDYGNKPTSLKMMKK